MLCIVVIVDCTHVHTQNTLLLLTQPMLGQQQPPQGLGKVAQENTTNQTHYQPNR